MQHPSAQDLRAFIRLNNRQFLKKRSRFIIPLIIFILLKLISAYLLVQRIEEKDFLSIFHGWDSYYYMSIATSFYPNKLAERWAFFPLYPFISHIVNRVFNDIWISAAIVSFIPGVIWIPIYQLISEKYNSAKESLYSACMFASFPQIFLFTSVAYSESLFLLTTLIAWVLYIRGKILYSCIAASFATLTRPYGIIIALPIFLGLIEKKLRMKILCILLPAGVLLGWLWYNFVKTGNYLAFMAAQDFWIGQPWQPSNWFKEFFIPLLNSEQLSETIAPQAAHIFLIPFIAITMYFIIITFRIDWKLGFYSLAVFLAILSFGTPLSAPRFIPFIFPIWLNIKTKRFIIALIVSAFFYMHALVAWFLFSFNIWVG